MARERHYCTVCRSWYRAWSLHASSKRHMGNLRKLANPATTGGRKGIRRGFSKLAGRHKRRHDDELKVHVDRYRRNPPTPPWPAWLTERLVRVRDHWRDPPQTLRDYSTGRRIRR